VFYHSIICIVCIVLYIMLYDYIHGTVLVEQNACLSNILIVRLSRRKNVSTVLEDKTIYYCLICYHTHTVDMFEHVLILESL